MYMITSALMSPIINGVSIHVLHSHCSKINTKKAHTRQTLDVLVTVRANEVQTASRFQTLKHMRLKASTAKSTITTDKQ